ncbi:MAG: c-type cytochrome biogenesis protein CcmI [Pseudomonadota bacterium]
MTAFVVIAALGMLVAIGVIAAPLITRRTDALNHDQADSQVFRDQLAEVDRDLARGAISPEEAEGARIEVSRRLLKADRESKTRSGLSPGPKGLSRAAAVIVLVAVPALALSLYAELGQPGLPGQPLEERITAASARLSQAEAESRAALDPAPPITDEELAEHLSRLEEIVATRPNDPEGQRLMGITQLRVGRYVAAREAFDRYLDLADQVSADTHASHAEAMVLAADGYVSREAGDALQQAFRKDPENRTARYYAGVALAQSGRFAEAIQLWQRLRAELPEGSQVALTLDALLADARGRLAMTVRPGPNQEDIEAAGQMTPEERAQMIAGMVARFETRLTSQGGEVEDWVRLMAMYMQLQRPEDARRIYDLGVAAQREQSARSFMKEQALLLGMKVE